MFWMNFLHIYQPPDQSEEILEKVANESYRPLFRGFLDASKKNPRLKVNLNINGCLTELLAKRGYRDVIENIRRLAEQGNLEFTESAKYHALLPFLNQERIISQIISNHQTNRRYFGSVYQPECFFPPEMAYSQKVGRVISKLGYKFILLDGISFNGQPDQFSSDRLFKINQTNLIPIFRERRRSNAIQSGLVWTVKEFKDLISEDLYRNKYLCTAMDGETFGHHHIDLDKPLIKIVSTGQPNQIFLSEVVKYFPVEKGTIEPVASTWASTQNDLEKGLQFYSWHDPQNKVHRLQWRLVRFLLRKVKQQKYLSSKQQDKVNCALASDQFFWASGEPWWSIENIEKGAWITLEAIKNLPRITSREVKEAESIYRHILSIAFWWQRSGKIERQIKKYQEAVKIPFKERTFEIGGEEIYQQVVELMKKQMKEAAQRKNYERAIVWRDAIKKIENKNDIYDLMHIVDLLRVDLPREFKTIDPQLNALFAKYKEKYQKIASGQPEARGIKKRIKKQQNRE